VPVAAAAPAVASLAASAGPTPSVTDALPIHVSVLPTTMPSTKMMTMKAMKRSKFKIS
jgi:hypothetical protein